MRRHGRRIAVLPGSDSIHTMFWADRICDDIQNQPRFAQKIKDGKPLLIRDEKTASGQVHVGSMRGVAVHGAVSRVLTERGVANTFRYEINDMDPMDGLPAYLDPSEFTPHMGKPLYAVPSPDGLSKNFPEFYGREFQEVITHADFHPEFYRLSPFYQDGSFDEVIRMALEKADTIREIYKKVSGSTKEDKWLPLSVICQNCGKMGTTTAIAFDGDVVTYRCDSNKVDWAEGCGHEGTISPFGGNAKLPWKVEWAAKWKVFGVDIEGAGKDHSTRGGSRDVANTISREVFEYEPPFDIPYEFFLVGGKKMSSSKGNAASAKAVSDLLPPHLFRLALLGKEPKQQIDFDPMGDTVPLLFDRYDRIAEKTWSGIVEDDTRLFEMIHRKGENLFTEKRYLPRFSVVAYLSQMPHVDTEKYFETQKGSELTDGDSKELQLRLEYASYWLSQYAPEDYKFELQDEIPDAVSAFTDLQKAALGKVLDYVEAHNPVDGQELHTALHDIKAGAGIPPADFFSALYISFLGKPSGPKAGWFLSVLDRSFVIRRLQEVAR